MNEIGKSVTHGKNIMGDILYKLGIYRFDTLVGALPPRLSRVVEDESAARSTYSTLNHTLHDVYQICFPSSLTEDFPLASFSSQHLFGFYPDTESQRGQADRIYLRTRAHHPSLSGRCRVYAQGFRPPPGSVRMRIRCRRP